MRGDAAIRDVSALLRTLWTYWVGVWPAVRRELTLWESITAEIPDPELRRDAIATLADEASLAEGAAIFATLAPRRHRAQLLRTLVAFQLLYDYLDTIAESLPARTLDAERDAFTPLLEALGETPATRHAAAPRADELYVGRLVAVCRRNLCELPGTGAIAAIAATAARRCIEGQARTHLTLKSGDAEELRRWATAEAAGGYEWWEIAGGAISSLAVHAVLAVAAEPLADAAVAAAINAAYAPAVCAASTILDSLIDAERDQASGGHSYISYYVSQAAAAHAAQLLIGRALTAVRALPQGRRHAVIVSGMVALYYRSASPRTRPLLAAALRDGGHGARPILATLRLRDRLRRPRQTTGPSPRWFRMAGRLGRRSVGHPPAQEGADDVRHDASRRL